MALPERLGRLHVLRRAGAGGFASVWLAHDPALDSIVAVKVLADNWAHRSDVRERFLAEARLLRRVDRDGVVRVYDIGELPDGRPWFAMTYADRGTLSDRLPWRGGPGGAMALLHDLAAAVDTLHQHGIVHRDLAPGNILFVADPRAGERVLVGDLGLAKDLGFASGLTQPGGTGPYRAPEQREVSDQVGPSTDVYALSVLAAELLGDTLTPAQRDVLTRARSENPPDRQGSAGDLVRQLRAASVTAPGVVPPTDLPPHEGLPPEVPNLPPGKTRTPGATRRHRHWVVAGALGILLLVAAPLAWATMNREDTARIETPDTLLALTMESDGWDRVGDAHIASAQASTGITVRREDVTVTLAFTNESVEGAEMASAWVFLDCADTDLQPIERGSWTGLAVISTGCSDGTQQIELGLGDPDRGAAYVQVIGDESVPDVNTLLVGLELPAG